MIAVNKMVIIMIKRVISFLTLFIIALCSYSQSDTITGNVKSIREELVFLNRPHQYPQSLNNLGDYDYVHDEFSSVKRAKSKFLYWWYNTPWVHYSNYYKEFLEHGKPISETWFYENGDTVMTYKYVYETNFNQIQIKSVRNDHSYSCENFAYNSKNIKITSISYDSRNPDNYSYNTFKYNEDGDLVEEKHFDEDGEDSGRKYEYYSNGKISKELDHYTIVWDYMQLEQSKILTYRKDDVGLYLIYAEYFYDKNWNLIKTKYYEPDSRNPNIASCVGITTRKYDDTNRKTGEYYSDESKLTSAHTEYAYYINDQIKTEMFIHLIDSTDYYLVEYFYTDNNYIEKLIYSKYKEVITVEFDYEFDYQNNWIKQTKTVDGEKLYIWERDIKYYE